MWYRKNIRPVLSEVGSYSQGQQGYVVRELPPALDRWLRVAAALVGATRNQDTVTVMIGPAIEQRSLEDPVCKGVRHSARTKGVSE